MTYQKKIIEEVRKDEAINAIFKRIEKEHDSKIKRLVRQAKVDDDFCMTMILEDYTMLEVVLKPTQMSLFGLPSLEIEVEVW